MAHLLAATRARDRLLRLSLAVLAGEVGLGVAAPRLEAEVAAVYDQAFLPPCMSRMNLETGASGMLVKVERMPPWTESMRAERSMSAMPCRATTRSGRSWEEEHRKTGRRAVRRACRGECFGYKAGHIVGRVDCD